MRGVSEEKVPGGKLLRIKVDYSDKIENVQITGDFFLHPEESITKIEESLKGLDKNIAENDMADKISKKMEEEHIEMIGVDAVSIARVLKRAMI